MFCFLFDFFGALELKSAFEMTQIQGCSDKAQRLKWPFLNFWLEI